MINLNELNRFRITDGRIIDHFGSAGDGTCGAFAIKTYSGEVMMVIAANGEGWDHVSVSLQRRAPTWDEMEMVKRLFFKDDETAMQLHVPPANHINLHPNALHLWRPHDVPIPLPPVEFV